VKIVSYEIPTEEYFDLELPTNARILSATIEDYRTAGRLWVLVDPLCPTAEIRHFLLAITSRKTPVNVEPNGKELCHLASYILPQRNLCYHLFELLDVEDVVVASVRTETVSVPDAPLPSVYPVQLTPPSGLHRGRPPKQSK
jgi:hypothetical protein